MYDDHADDWLSLHVFYQDTDFLMREGVYPLFSGLTHSGGPEFFFIRYWERGPHVRLRVAGERQALEKIEREVRGHLEEFFDFYPSAGLADRSAYRQLVRRLAAAECRDDYDPRLRELDTVERIAYEPEVGRFGGDRAMRLAEEHFVQSSAISLRLLGSGLRRDRVAGWAAAAAVSALRMWEPDPGRLAAMFTTRPWSPNVSTPAVAEHAAALRRNLGKKDEMGVATHELASAKWASTIRSLIAGLGELWLQGDLRPTSSREWLPADEPTLSPGQAEVGTILLDCIHLLNNRLGLSLAHELYVRAVVERAIIDIGQGP